MMSDAIKKAEASGGLQQLAERLAAKQDFAKVFDRLRSGGEATLDGVWGSVRALAAAALAGAAPGPLVLIFPKQVEVDSFIDDLSIFGPHSGQPFPAWETDPGQQILHDEIYGDRLRLLKSFATDKSDSQPVIVTSIQSLMQPVPSRELLTGSSRVLREGESLDLPTFLKWLVENGFHATSAVELPGEFAARGGIVDLFAPDWQSPVRMELFGDEIESLRAFDVASQRSLLSLAQIDVTVLSAPQSDRDHLSSYLPANSWFALIEPADLEQQGKHYLQRIEDHESVHSVSGVFAELAKFACVTLESIATSTTETTYRFHTESVESFSGDLRKVREEIEQLDEGEQVNIVCLTEGDEQRLREILCETESVANQRIRFSRGNLHAGFRLPNQKLVLLSSSELFQQTDIKPSARRRLSRVIDTFLELNDGDLVVHLAHGIGRYRGLKLLKKEGQTEEHMELEFAGGTRIFVPASKINLVQKYVGGVKRRPSLAKIGGQSWVRKKAAAEQAATDLAVEMLEMQALREGRSGIQFAPDGKWQKEFDASFPYRETPDQLAGIGAIKKDMQSSRPMDRLLCGDVGFGKTELALRASFKAIENGYQVAILAPTTILVEQHYRTFKQRMAEFPFEIARLSRFGSRAEQKRNLKAIAGGQIDIVIGTHRLASKDVSFHNLGLVIIDEEQRFGVEVKQRLKAYRARVDVMTMTATPIPRTLHMSLLGLRSISNLETPPEQRIAVETRVTRFDEQAVRHAILRELNRGGQVFFVHNRVADIQQIANRLQQIVPEADIAIGHGQMPEGHLEKVMLDFVHHKFDVLLATTIIESGLDIPNANTIFIDDANRYGLADLHQLRGRVGRYKHRAYCYLLIDPDKHLTPAAARRLRAIEEFSRLGAGFAIAMRDLEIRGAGNILGTQQSGHIAAVGYELYCQLLEQSVRRLKKMPPKTLPEVHIDLPIEAFFPDRHVAEMRAKIDLYRRMGRISNLEELADFRGELEDRFGKCPPPVLRLLDLCRLRIAAFGWEVDSIHREDDYLVLGFRNPLQIRRLAKESGNRLRIADDSSAYLPLSRDVKGSEEILAAAKSLLQVGD